MTATQFEFNSQRSEFVRREIDKPTPQDGEILVRVKCCTICGSDLHTYSGRRNAPDGCVLGHEIIGAIDCWADEEAPTDFYGRKLQTGDRITWCMAVGCGDCFYCNRGLNQKCERLFKYGHASQAGHPTGGLSDYCLLVRGTPVFRVPESLPDKVACPANCATATVSAAIRLVCETHTLTGANVLVTGAGMLGLTAIAQLADANATNIIVVDRDESRLDLARKFGATHTVKADDAAAVKDTIDRLTAGRGADVAMDFAGVTPAVATCLEHARIGGCILLAGSVFASDAIPLLPEQIVRRMLVIRGLHNYIPQDLANALDFLERTYQRFPFEELVSKSFSLTETAEAFEYAATAGPVRVSVGPQQPDSA